MAANQVQPDKDAPSVTARARGGMVTGLHHDATRRVANTLSEDQLSKRRREGEEIDLDHVVVYAIAEIDAALTPRSANRQ